jgi:hypothetical protein
LSKLPKLLSFFLSLFLLFPFFISPVQSTNIITSKIPGYEDCYRDVQTINQTMDDLLYQYPSLVKLESIGFSYEDNPINVLTLSNQAITSDKPALILVSGLRANAFAPVELSLSFAEYLLQNYGLDADSTWILDYLSIHLILLANPDGRLMAESQAQAGLAITWQNNTNFDYCEADNVGVRLTLNFPFAWQEADPSTSCDTLYPGPSAGSEPETQAITEFLEDLALSEESMLLVNLDAGENEIRMPYLYDFSVENPHQNELFMLANKIAYDTASSPILNSTSNSSSSDGTLIDHAFGELNIPSLDFKMGADEVSYCWYYEEELRDLNIQALLRAAKATIEPYDRPFGPEIVIEEINEYSTFFNLVGYVDDFSFYKNPHENYSQIKNLEYSINTPVWDESIVPDSAKHLTPDEEFDFLSNFVISIPKVNLLPGRNTIFLQSWDSAEDPENSHPGLVSSAFLDVPIVDDPIVDDPIVEDPIIDLPFELFLPMSLK